MGKIPPEIPLPLSFAEVSRRIKTLTGAMVIGLHDRQRYRDHLNPDDDVPVTQAMTVVYLAQEPVLEDG